MTKPKVLREFTENDNYFTIRQVMQVFTGYVVIDGKPKYLYKLVGLGTDDRLYRYTPGGWVALIGVN